MTIPATREEVKKRIRLLREQEAGAIEEIDDQIASTQQRLRELRDKRDVLVRDAFSRGNVVTLKELTEQADNG